MKIKKTYLLDTNIVSEFAKDRPDMQVIDFYNARRDLCAISAITWQEIIRGVTRMPEGKKKSSLEKFIESLEENIEVISYDKYAAQICGELQSAAEKDGKSLPFYDSQIAATAVSNGMVLVTHNTSDFEQFKEKSFLRLEDWFTA
ncbi:MAG: type II toxin-antitoxin system VapC family toxin [Oscillospiraceae bacterium]|nr:type II toxin-antitoxin system VapC family toxin [Oscillospiraceae bacterium]